MKQLLSDPRSTAGRPSESRRLLGQVMTPDNLAALMDEELLKDSVSDGTTILDPCVGEGALIHAVSKTGGKALKPTIVDVDASMALRAKTRAAAVI